MFELVDAEKAHFPVQVLCEVLDVSRSGFYAWKTRAPSARQKSDDRLAVEIAATHAKSKKRYGSPRVHRALRKKGICVGKKRIARLMREKGIVARQKRRFRRTTDSNHANPIAPNVVARDFEPAGPNQVWAGDVTYVATAEGWAYLAVLLDLFSRRVVGWAMSETNDTELALAALARAVCSRHFVPAGLVHHTDRGSPGEFNRSSQRLDSEELRWVHRNVDGPIVRGALRCVLRGVRRPVDAKIDKCSGRRLLVG
jgi:transposase InsO family protein